MYKAEFECTSNGDMVIYTKTYFVFLIFHLLYKSYKLLWSTYSIFSVLCFSYSDERLSMVLWGRFAVDVSDAIQLRSE